MSEERRAAAPVASSLTETLHQDGVARERARRLSSGVPRAPGHQIVRRLGAGAYGEVWEAVQENTGVRVAIKFFSRHEGLDWPLLKREVDSLAKLSNERRIVQLLHVGWQADPPFYVMEYLAGGSLADRLEEQGALPVDEALGLFRDIARALVYLHGRAILHCDLKPSNVLLDDSGQVRLADFGQARVVDEALPAGGTLFYMAPEQADFDAVADVRSDVYSLGALLYAMLTGRPPYASESASRELASSPTASDRLERYSALLLEAPPPLKHRQVRGVDRGLAAIVERCLALDPSRRFENVQQILDALVTRARHRSQRPLVTLGLLGPLVLLVAVAALGFWVEQEAKRDASAALARQTMTGLATAAEVTAAAVDYNLQAMQRRVEREAHNDVWQVLLPQLELAPPADQASGLRRQIESELDKLYQRYRARDFASWQISDRRGTFWARAPIAPRLSSRSPADQEWFSSIVGSAPSSESIGPRHTSGLALVARPGGAAWVGVVSPIWSPVGDEVTGVLAATIAPDVFSNWLRNVEAERLAGGCPERFVTLIYRDQVIYHPCLEAEDTLPLSRDRLYETAEFQRFLQHDSQADPAGARFADPLRGGQVYLASWKRLADYEDWLVVVQQDRMRALEPLDKLAARFNRFAWIAILIGLTVVFLFWLLLFRATRTAPMQHG